MGIEIISFERASYILAIFKDVTIATAAATQRCGKQQYQPGAVDEKYDVEMP